MQLVSAASSAQMNKAVCQLGTALSFLVSSATSVQLETAVVMMDTSAPSAYLGTALASEQLGVVAHSVKM